MRKDIFFRLILNLVFWIVVHTITDISIKYLQYYKTYAKIIPCQQKANGLNRPKLKKRKSKNKKRKEKEKRHRDNNKSDEFPSRIRIIKHTDGSELIIKPYHFFRLLLKVHFLYYWVFGAVLAPPMAIWIFACIFLGNFLNTLDLPVYLVVLTPILSLLLGVYIISLLVFVILTIKIRYSDYQLNIRLSKNNYCGFYHKKPSKPFYIGDKINYISKHILTIINYQITREKQISIGLLLK